MKKIEALVGLQKLEGFTHHSYSCCFEFYDTRNCYCFGEILSQLIDCDSYDRMGVFGLLTGVLFGRIQSLLIEVNFYT